MDSHMTENCGVVYVFGNLYEEMALVSIFSLRTKARWRGPVCVFPMWSSSRPRVLEVSRMMAGDKRLDIQLGPPVRAIIPEAAERLGGGRAGDGHENTSSVCHAISAHAPRRCRHGHSPTH